MPRAIFWVITFAAILGTCFTYNVSAVPREYATIVPPDALLNFHNALAVGSALFLVNCAACLGTLGSGQDKTKPAFESKPADFTDRARMQTLSLNTFSGASAKVTASSRFVRKVRLC